ncbi:PilZ domain-containing protein [Sphingomonas sp. URHD0057]|uniref:PilZ domain-containing protein n=1 Tax=Sphingomonas sp. URHD0057 TaxID=1380389 RepID=UPI00048F4428|nr:PilZ domain-containing protein [Sphingomonas sp. URHD0057]
MTDAASITVVVMGDLLPWPEDERVPDAGPFDPAAIHHCGTRRECVIRRISSLGVTVGSDLVPTLGDRVAVELATGQRPAGKIAWTGARQLGVCFEDSIDVIALLNRKLISQDRERRTMPRVEVRAPVQVKSGEHFWYATLRNISANGLQLEGNELPALGAYVTPFIEGLNVPSGEVVWKRDGRVGIEVMEQLSWTSIIPWIRATVKKSAN